MRETKEIAKQVHRQRALAVLGPDPTARWLAQRPEVLDELGRIDCDYALLVIAKRIAELKPATSAAIEMIRRHREFNQLADEIIHVVEDYCKRHPSTSRSEILRAIESAGVMLGRVGAEEVGRHQFLRRTGVAVA